jgi:hypothetical protein
MALIELSQGRRHLSRPNTEPRSASVKLRLQFVASGAYPVNTRSIRVVQSWRPDDEDKPGRRVLG